MSETILKDKLLTCKVCGDEFIFSTGEQEFYKDRWLAEPKRCRNCRASKRRPNFKANSGEGGQND